METRAEKRTREVPYEKTNPFEWIIDTNHSL